MITGYPELRGQFPGIRMSEYYSITTLFSGISQILIEYLVIAEYFHGAIVNIVMKIALLLFLNVREN